MSLANRIALLFAASTALVSLIAGLLFSQASARHFVELDHQLLDGKLAVYRQLLGNDARKEALLQRLPALREELARHPELSLTLLGADGQPWFSSAPPDGHALAHDSPRRSLSAPLLPEQPQGPTLQLSLDIGHHQHFLAQMQRLIWLTMGLAALATALLGLWMARRGLAPLKRLTALSEGISARSLGQRLDTGDLPAELAPLIEAFNAMLARLQDAFERLSGFSADIAHELRTPLSNLLTQTQVTLGQPRSPEAYREALHDNLEELQQLTQMVNDMLFLAKAEHGLLSPQRQRLALHEEVAALLEFFAPLAEEQGVSLAQHGQAWLDGDQRMLRRALSNLLDNALRFTAHGAAIRVELEECEREIRLEVANQGPAIPPEQQARLFDRFYRADPARREGRNEHAGLGLAITRSIVRAHGGEIAVRCAEDWTRFTLRLPR